MFAADCVVEVGGITLQAWRRMPSHLDMETPFDTAVSMTLAVGGGILVVLLAVFAVGILPTPAGGAYGDGASGACPGSRSCSWRWPRAPR